MGEHGNEFPSEGIDQRLTNLMTSVSMTDEKADRSKTHTNREALQLIAKGTTDDERIAAVRVMAKAVNLNEETTANLIQIASDEEAFLDEFHHVLKNAEQPIPVELYGDYGSTEGRAFGFVIHDWSCRWKYNYEDGTEVGPDFWMAAFLCALAHSSTDMRSFLDFHEHILFPPKLNFKFPVLTFPF